MASAADLPSPVAIMTLMPSFFRERIASGLSGLMGSDMSADPMNPPSSAAITQVIPARS
jgi:hypothetical protein